jgi:hypothetical protein
VHVDTVTLRANAKLKATSAVTTNLGAALAAAAAARWFSFGADPIAPVWSLAAALIIWAGINVLADLQGEQPNG